MKVFHDPLIAFRWQRGVNTCAKLCSIDFLHTSILCAVLFHDIDSQLNSFQYQAPTIQNVLFFSPECKFFHNSVFYAGI